MYGRRGGSGSDWWHIIRRSSVDVIRIWFPQPIHLALDTKPKLMDDVVMKRTECSQIAGIIGSAPRNFEDMVKFNEPVTAADFLEFHHKAGIV